MRGLGSRWAAALVASFTLACGISGSGAAGAATVVPCATRVTSTPFASFGDTTPYFLMSGGNFESGNAGWAFNAPSSIVGGNESYNAAGATDSHSAAIATGSSVTSPTICIGRGELMLRLFAKNPAVTGSQLKVQINVQDPSSARVVSTAMTVNSTTSATWSPTNQMRVANLLGGSTGTEYVTITLSTSGTPGTWNIDDVFVDPFKVR